jgi:hypothetical protein
LVIYMTSRGSAFWAGFFCAVAAFVCGCGGNSNHTTQQTAPSTLSYAQASIAAVVGEAISADTPTVTGTVAAYSVNPALPSGVTLNSTTGTIAGTPSAVTATATYTVTASNAAGSTTAAVKIGVATAPIPAPSGLTYPQTTISATVGQPITADTPTVTGTVTSYAVSPALPAGLVIDATAGTISGTPTEAAASSAYVVTASNSSGSTTATLQIAVAAATPPPATFQYGTASIQWPAGVAIQPDTPNGSYYNIAATTFTISPALPTGLLIGSNNGEIYGTPAAASPATSYTVTATNASGIATATVQITITAEQPPSFQFYQSTINAYVGQPIAADSINPYSLQYGGPISSLSVTPALPAGLNLSQATGTIAGIPTVATPSTTYTVSATNAAGSTTSALQISVGALQAPSAIVYPQTSIATYTGQPITPNIPGTSGGPVASYSISPALPAGLSMSKSTGIISGTPTGTSAQTNYVVTGTNPAGSISSAQVSITITAKPIVLMQLGSSTGPLLFANGSVFSGGGGTAGGPWTLWNYQMGTIVASGDNGLGSKSVSVGYGYSYPYEPNQMAGPTVAIQIRGGIEVLSSADGHLLGTIASPGYMYGLASNAPPPDPPAVVGLNENDMWQLSSDGSYISIETQAGLYVYSPSGQLLFTEAGDYFEPATSALIDSLTATVGVFAAPGHVMIANGPAGANAIENVTVPGGTSTVASPYQGLFYAWFGDGDHFFTQYGYYSRNLFSQQIYPPLPDAALYVYSSTSVQLSSAQPSGICVGGWGNWVWNFCSSTADLTVSAIGSPTPALTYNSLDIESVVASGPTVAVLPVQQAMVVVDLSGSTPVQTNYSLPPFPGNEDNGYPLGTFAAESGNKWVVDFYNKGILDGPSLNASTPRFIGSGYITSVAGSTDRVAIANGGEQVTWYDPSNTTPQGSETSASGYTELSTDGTVMGAASTDGTLLNFYSLPSGTITNNISDPNAAGQNFTLSLSGNGTTYGTLIGYVDKNGGTYTAQVAPVAGGLSILSVTQPQLQLPLALSPDGTLVAFCCDANNVSNFLIYKNGKEIESLPGSPIGWLDNNRLLAGVSGSFAIYSPNGAILANPPLPHVWTTFQTVTSDTIYIPWLNGIYSLTTGQPTWSSPYHADADATQWGPGAVAGDYVVFESEGNILAIPWQ